MDLAFRFYNLNLHSHFVLIITAHFTSPITRPFPVSYTPGRGAYVAHRRGGACVFSASPVIKYANEIFLFFVFCVLWRAEI